MASPPVAAPSRKRTFLRSWLPWIILAIGVTAAALVWFWPSEELERANRVVFATWIIAPLTLILLGLWVLGLSGWTWRTRLIVVLVPLVLAAIGWAAAVREVRLTGDMVPRFRLRWEKTPDEVREAHRQSAGVAVSWEPGDLSGKLPTDFPEYRGRKRDGVVHGPALARSWPTRLPRQLWRQPGGGGYSAFALAGNAAVTLEQRRDEEAVVCYDAATGKEVWTYSYKALFTETLGGPGPRATPTIADGEVYSLGAQGDLVCLDAATGKLKWAVNILENNNNVQWGMSGSPLVYDRVVVVNPGAQTDAAKGKALVAYDRATGQVVWTAGNSRAGYSSPMLATLAGRRQILLFDGEGLGGYDAATGAELWRYPWQTHMGINVAQPVVLDGDRVFISSGYNVGGALLRIREKDGQWSVEPLWKNTLMRCKFTSPVAREGYLYGLDDGVLVCLDQETGKRAWRGDRYGHGQVLLADDLLLVLSETGELVLVEATPEAYRELGRFAALEGKTWNVPALAGGKVYVRNDREMACYDLTGP
ncbi:MAG TPA: PQQ-binding-like beta-propeller repeat protein [Gemmataceae bacterium]|nr:PQQ-binding-like beta-propeller repeat protein [Gemmataceae bacterium]